jgi:hypothetical protein
VEQVWTTLANGRSRTIALVVTVLALVADAAWTYGKEFTVLLHSDSANTALLAAAALRSHSLFTDQWYFANGDLWVFAPHVFSLVPVAIGGPGPYTLLAGDLFGFVTELAALGWAYRRLGSIRSAAFATCVTMMAWSWIHLRIIYMELAYGLFATLYAVSFVLVGSVVARAPRRHLAAAPIVVGALALQNPTRVLVMLLVPLLVACAWPWKGAERKRRVTGLFVALAPWAAGLLFYRLWLKPHATIAIPSGESSFDPKSLSGIADNLRLLWEGLVLLAGNLDGFGVLAIPGLVWMAASVALVAAHALASRTFTLLRFVCVAAIAQLGAVLGPLVLGNLLLDSHSIRYIAPSLFVVSGLAIVVALEQAPARPWARRATIAFAAFVPLLAVFAFGRLVGDYRRPPRHDSQVALADAARSRGLSHGFATYWNANVVTLLARGGARSCPVNFAERVLPYRFGTDVTCFDRAAMPDRFFVAALPEERDDAARAAAATFGPELERFTAGDFEVRVFRTDQASPTWLLPPVDEPKPLRFPLRVAAAHPQMRHDKATVQGTRVESTGEDGTIVFGPYVDLPKGRYRVRWRGRVLSSPGELDFDVVASGGAATLARRSAHAADLADGGEGDLVTMEIEADAPAKGVEARVFARGGARIVLTALVIERL